MFCPANLGGGAAQVTVSFFRVDHLVKLGLEGVFLSMGAFGDKGPFVEFFSTYSPPGVESIRHYPTTPPRPFSNNLDGLDVRVKEERHPVVDVRLLDERWVSRNDLKRRNLWRMKV